MNYTSQNTNIMANDNPLVVAVRKDIEDFLSLFEKPLPGQRHGELSGAIFFHVVHYKCNDFPR